MKKLTCESARCLALQPLDDQTFPTRARVPSHLTPSTIHTSMHFSRFNFCFSTSRDASSPLSSFLSTRHLQYPWKALEQPHVSEVSSFGGDLPALLSTTAGSGKEGSSRHWLRSKKPGQDPHPAAETLDESPHVTEEPMNSPQVQICLLLSGVRSSLPWESP